MKISEVVKPMEIDISLKMVDILKSDAELIRKTYELHDEIKEGSSYNKMPYILLPGKVHRDDLNYIIEIVKTLRNELISNGLSTDDQLVKLLDESLNYLLIKM